MIFLKNNRSLTTIYDQTVLQQKQGTASLTDVLLADNALREAQQNYLNALLYRDWETDRKSVV